MENTHTKLDSRLRKMLVKLPQGQKTGVLVHCQAPEGALEQYLRGRAALDGLSFTRLPLSGYWLVYANPAQILDIAARTDVQEITARPPRPAAAEKHRDRAA